MGGSKGLSFAVAAALFAACSPPGTSSLIIGPTGGTVCLPEDKVCVDVPPGALTVGLTIKIQPGTDRPAGAFLDAWDIGPAGTTFLKPVTVVFKVDPLFEPDSGVAWSEEAMAGKSGVDPLKLRLYTRYEDGPWEPLGISVPPLDRIRRTLSGQVTHLSPFAILRTDRLADGGVPGGSSDGGQ